MIMIKSLTKFFIWLAVALTSGILLSAMGIYLYLAPTLPDPYELRNINLQLPLKIYTQDKKLIAEFGEKRRTPIVYKQTPPTFIQALLAAEDDAFFEHSGVDIKGLLRASLQLLLTGEKKSGGSTITMQVARNYYLSREKTFERKFTEILLALKMERFLSKEEILSLYINKVFLGKSAYGIEAAAQMYYGKTIKQLNLAQLAMIAGLPQAPSSANPIINPTRAKFRRNYVLKRMLDIGHISEEEYLQASTAPISAKAQQTTRKELNADYAAEMVRLELIKRFGNDAYTLGLKVITSIDSKRQKAANTALQHGLLQYDRDHGLRQQPDSNIWSVSALETPNKPSLADYQAHIEQDFKTLNVSPEVITLTYEDAQTDWLATLKDWQAKLIKINTLGVISPAVVITSNDNGAWLWTKTGSQWLDFSQMQWAKPYLSADSVGAEPTSATQVLKAQQFVWIETLKEGQIKLAQLPEVQGALVSLNANDGGITAIVGGFHHANNKFNRVTQSERQPGSAFKPFIYSSALHHGLTAASLINDAPVVFEDTSLEYTWRPENVSGKFYGPTRLRRALFRSQNLVSIRILKQMGVDAAIDFIKPFGFEQTTFNKDLSLALGASAVSPLTLAQGYAAFANGGYRINPYLIDEIYDNNNVLIYKAHPEMACPNCQNAPVAADIPIENAFVRLGLEPEAKANLAAKQVIDERTRFIMLTMLRDVVARGTGKRALALNRQDTVGKTGTTNEQKDAWFSGFANQLVTTVWVGFDQPRSLGRWAYGSNTALPIWVEYMQTALQGVEDTPPVQPAGVVSVRIDPETGLLAPPEQNDAIFEYFKQENVPSEYAPNKTGISSQSGSGQKTQAPEQIFN